MACGDVILQRGGDHRRADRLPGAISQRLLRRGGALAISPCGGTAYLTFSAYGMLVLARDPATGALSSSRRAVAVRSPATSVAGARGLLAPSDLLVPPDASNVYAVSPDSAVSAFAVADRSARAEASGRRPELRRIDEAEFRALERVVKVNSR